MRGGWVLCALLSSASAIPAHAEIAVLTNGLTFKTTSHRLEDSVLILVLKGGGEVGLPPTAVRGFVPDEIVEEVATTGGDIRTLAIQAAERHGLDPDLVLAVVAVESSFRPEAQSPKGAQGLMQLMPATAAELGVKNAFDPAENLDGGTRHLGALLTLYGGDLTRALAAYNAGVGAVAKSKGVPPYRETQQYVRKVLKQYKPKPEK
jgi:soluble lytic murein transglycosylase-like protein